MKFEYDLFVIGGGAGVFSNPAGGPAIRDSLFGTDEIDGQFKLGRSWFEA